ncbi:transporter substrate-binding domain-containing protein [Desulfobacterales bacterium HSG2]|nr:transporter substrate-binding domain-containing protein [Desulfobacterales bacterium HSG2]
MKRRNLKEIVTVLLAVAVFLSPVRVFAEKAVFVSLEDLPPKVYKEDGKLKGIYVDIIREICKRISIRAEFQLYPWKRCVMMVKDGDADAIFPPFLTQERTEFLYFPSEPMTVTRNVIFARNKSGIRIERLDDLKGLIVGINRGYSYGPEFDAYKKNLKLEYCKDEEMQIKKLSEGSPELKRMDVAVASEEPFRFKSKKLGFSDTFEVIYVLSEKPSYVAFSKAVGQKGKMLSEKFSQALSQLKKEGIIQKIQNNYFK